MAWQYHTEGATTLSATAWSGSGFATAGDDFALQRGTQAIITGLDQSAQSACGLFLIPRTFTGSLGTSSSSAKFACNTEFRNDAGSGQLYYTPTSADATTTALFTQTGFGQVTINGTGTLTTLHVGAGTVDVGTSIDVPTVVAAGGRTTFASGSDTHDAITMMGGAVKTERSFAANKTINIAGGSFVQANPQAVIGSSTTVNIYNGLFDWRGVFSSAATVNWFGGSIDFSRVSRNTTLPTLNIYGGVKPGIVRDVLKQITITTTNYRIGAVTGAGTGITLGMGSGG